MKAPTAFWLNIAFGVWISVSSSARAEHVSELGRGLALSTAQEGLLANADGKNPDSEEGPEAKRKRKSEELVQAMDSWLELQGQISEGATESDPEGLKEALNIHEREIQRLLSGSGFSREQQQALTKNFLEKEKESLERSKERVLEKVRVLGGTTVGEQKFQESARLNKSLIEIGSRIYFNEKASQKVEKGQGVISFNEYFRPGSPPALELGPQQIRQSLFPEFQEIKGQQLGLLPDAVDYYYKAPSLESLR